MTRPKPVHLIVCDTCDLPWEDHEDTFYADEDLGDPITTATCVKLLKKAHQGPPGPVGPMGPRGDAGKDGQDGRHGLPAPQPYPMSPYPYPRPWTHTTINNADYEPPRGGA